MGAGAGLLARFGCGERVNQVLLGLGKLVSIYDVRMHQVAWNERTHCLSWGVSMVEFLLMCKGGWN